MATSPEAPAPAARTPRDTAEAFIARRSTTLAALGHEAGRLTDELVAQGRQDLAEQVQAALPAGVRMARHVRAFPAPAGGFSFRAALTARTALSAVARRAGRPLTAWVVNDKGRARRLVEALGVRTPRILAAGLAPDAVEFLPDRTIKPHRGHSARGVFVVAGDGSVIDLGANVRVDAAEAKRRLLAHQALPGNARLVWHAEERIAGLGVELPDDLKRLSFYGEVPLAQDNRRLAEVRRNWYGADGGITVTGWKDDERFPGVAPSPDEFALTRAIGAAVPAPFLRIDFLRAADGGLVFAEFTPRPGSWAHVNAATDAVLGAAHARAEARLTADLAEGKPFEAFRAVLPRRDR